MTWELNNRSINHIDLVLHLRGVSHSGLHLEMADRPNMFYVEISKYTTQMLKMVTQTYFETFTCGKIEQIERSTTFGKIQQVCSLKKKYYFR